MQILFITDDFYPRLGANSLIVKALGEELVRDGHTVYVIPFSDRTDLPAHEEWGGMHILRTVRGDDKASLLNLIKHLRIADALRILKRRVSGKKSVWGLETVSAGYAVERVIGEYHIDLAVSVHCSVECSFPLYRLKKKHKLPCKWLLYMLDPFATHSYYMEKYDQRELQSVQHKLLAACDKVLCSDIIAKEIREAETEDIVRKLEVAEYPKIQDIRAKATPMSFDAGHTHCVYVGTFEQIVRPSDYLFSVIDRLRDTDLVFHFVGVKWEKDNIFATPDRTNCVFHGRVPWEEALSFECGCDYLINIGNKVQNQFPSKVLEYICTGKPIINVSKHRDDLTAGHFERYGNSLTVFEDEDAEAVAEQIRQYVACKHTDMDYDTVKELFSVGTPQYVAKQIERT